MTQQIEVEPTQIREIRAPVRDPRRAGSVQKRECSSFSEASFHHVHHRSGHLPSR